MQKFINKFVLHTIQLKFDIRLKIAYFIKFFKTTFVRVKIQNKILKNCRIFKRYKFLFASELKQNETKRVWYQKMLESWITN